MKAQSSMIKVIIFFIILIFYLFYNLLKPNFTLFVEMKCTPPLLYHTLPENEPLSTCWVSKSSFYIFRVS